MIVSKQTEEKCQFLYIGMQNIVPHFFITISKDYDSSIISGKEISSRRSNYFLVTNDAVDVLVFNAF